MADPIVLKWEQEGLPELIRVLDRFNKTLGETEKDADKAKRSTRGVRHESSKLRKQAKETSRAMRVFGDSFSGINSAAGRATRTTGRLLGVFSNLSAAGGPTGILLAGISAGIFGVAGAAAAGSAGLVKFAASGRQVIEDLAPLRDDGLLPEIEPETLAAFDTVKGSLEAMKNLAKGLGLALSQEFAPQLERGAVLAVSLGLAGLDAFNTFAEGGHLAHKVMRDLAVFLGSTFIQALASPVTIILNFVKMIGDLYNAMAAGQQRVANAARDMGLDGVASGLEMLSGALGEDGIGGALTYLDRKWDDATDAAAAFVVDGLGVVDKGFAVVEGAFGRATAGLESYEDRARSLIETSLRMSAATEGNNEALKAQAALERILAGLRGEALSGNDKIIFQYEQQIAKIQELQALGADAAMAQQAQNVAAANAFNALFDSNAEAVTKAWAEVGRVYGDAYRQLDDFHKQYVQSITSSVSSTLTGMASFAGSMAQVMARNGSKGAMAAFRTQQALSLANIGLLTAEAVMRGMVSPTPILGAAAAAATGASQAAAVVTQPPPKVDSQSHIGREIAETGRGQVSSPGVAPDERVKVLNGEGVVNTAGMNVLLNAINAGQSPTNSSRMRAVVGPGHLDRELDRSSRGGTSRFAKSQRRRSSAIDMGSSGL